MSDPHIPGPENAPSRLTRRDELLLFLLALGVRAAALPAAPGPETGELPHGAGLTAARLLSVLLGSLAVSLLARAGERLGGRATGLAAGGLLALAPGTVAGSALAGAVGALGLAGSGLLLGLLVWCRTHRLVALAATLLFGGLIVAPELGGPLRLASLVSPPVLPEASGPSPLADGLRELASQLGIGTALLAAIGALFVAIARDPFREIPNGGRGGTLLAAGVALLAVVLVRRGPDPGALAAVAPAGVLLAVTGLGAIGGRRGRPPRSAPRLSRIGLVAAVVLAAALTAPHVLGRRLPTPAARSLAWIRGNVEEPAVLLVENGYLGRHALPAPDETAGAELLLFPPPGVGAGSAGTIFYDPNLASVFPWMVLEDRLPPGRVEPGNDERVRRAFRDFFRREWTPEARFETGLSERPGVTVLRRPEGWTLDRESLPDTLTTLAGKELTAVRDSSEAMTDWLVAAGSALRRTGDVRGARRCLGFAEERRPEDAEVLFQRALVHLIDGEVGAARSKLLTALLHDSDHGGVHYNLGQIFEAEGDREGAIVEYAAAILTLDDPAPAHARLGALLLALGRRDEAVEQLEKIREIAPGSEAERFLEEALAGS
jgi:hypothetical protein